MSEPLIELLVNQAVSIWLTNNIGDASEITEEALYDYLLASLTTFPDSVQPQTLQEAYSNLSTLINANKAAIQSNTLLVATLNTSLSSLAAVLATKIASLSEDTAPTLANDLDLSGNDLTVDSGTVTNAELYMLHGVTSAIQTQLNNKVSASALDNKVDLNFLNVPHPEDAREALQATGNFFKRTVYTSGSGYFSPSSNTKAILATIVGGGGGGGNAVGGGSGYASAGGGGGSGACCIGITQTIGALYTYSVGSGGTPGSGGSASTFSGTGLSMTANGGGGGANCTSPVTGPTYWIGAAGSGGSASGGGVNLSGNPGEFGMCYYSRPISLPNGGAAPGPYGGGGGRANLGGATVGGGGGGGYQWNTSSTSYGTNGGGGVIVVDEYR